LNSRLATTTSRAERAEANFAERSSLAERMSSARERGETVSIDIAQDPHNLEMFRRYAEQYGGNSASAMVMFDAELARQGLKPNRTFTDGTALPASFTDLHRQHEIEAAGYRSHSEIEDRQHGNSQAVTDFGPTAANPTRQRRPSAIRAEIQTQGESLKHRARADLGEFDAKAAIVPEDDGTLASKNSLLVKSGRQVAKDASATFEAGKNLAERLLNDGK
jgi:conjugal transfer mating pair stabilization protein TraG